MIKQQKLSEKNANKIANLIITAIFKMNNDDLFTFYKKIKEELKRRGFDV